MATNASVIITLKRNQWHHSFLDTKKYSVNSLFHIVTMNTEKIYDLQYFVNDGHFSCIQFQTFYFPGKTKLIHLTDITVLYRECKRLLIVGTS
jgi:hypothetical protein